MQAEQQVRAAMGALSGTLGEALLAVYLHGSAVSGGLRPESDIDLLAVIDRPLTLAQSRELLSALLRLSGRHPSAPGSPRCLEVMVFAASDLAGPDAPVRAEFVYGEWLRDAFEAGEGPTPARDPEHTLVLAQARGEARPLLGPDAAALLPEIGLAQVRAAIGEMLPALLDGLDGDVRNVLLTLARMWRTVTTGEFVPKDAAACWAAAQMPAAEAATLALAGEAYLGRVAEDWTGRGEAVRATAEYLRRRVEEGLAV